MKIKNKKIICFLLAVLLLILAVIFVRKAFVKENTENIQISKEDLEFVLSRDIFMFKEDLSVLYGEEIGDLEAFEPYREQWKFGDLLNEQYFLKDTMEWFYATNNNVEEATGVYFQGIIKESGAELKLFFTWNDGALIPLLGAYVIKPEQGETEEVWAVDYIDKGAEVAIFEGDIRFSSRVALEVYGDAE